MNRIAERKLIVRRQGAHIPDEAEGKIFGPGLSAAVELVNSIKLDVHKEYNEGPVDRSVTWLKKRFYLRRNHT